MLKRIVLYSGKFISVRTRQVIEKGHSEGQVRGKSFKVRWAAFLRSNVPRILSLKEIPKKMLSWMRVQSFKLHSADSKHHVAFEFSIPCRLVQLLARFSACFKFIGTHTLVCVHPRRFRDD